MSSKWFEYDGESTEALLALRNQCRTDSLVLAFEQAIQQKAAVALLSREERYVLAVEGLEREVNNGGYEQFFLNSSCEFVDIVEEALRAIGCPKTAEMTRHAIRALGLNGTETSEEISDLVLADRPEVTRALGVCDSRYFANDEPIADRLFAWIENHRASVRVGDRPA
jgi:hypothetical protein